jgi:hypothetical protein
MLGDSSKNESDIEAAFRRAFHQNSDIGDTNLPEAIYYSFQSGGPNGDQSLIEVIDNLADSTNRIAKAITADAAPGRDVTGGTVASLTEAVMGITSGLVQIAEAIKSLADAVNYAGKE